jgi:universal stress protein E
VAVFENILVGIDLSPRAGPEGAVPGPDGEAALAQARWLAARTGGRLTFFSAVANPDPAREVLEALVRRHRDLGIAATARVSSGKGWVELLHQAARDRHDLVVLGARAEPGFWHTLFGGTTTHLVHQCPCPVWVARRMAQDGPRRILVPSNPGPASEEALRVGVALARLSDQARLHVLHVIEYPLDRIWATGQSDEWTQAYRNRVRSEAAQTIRLQLNRAGLGPGEDVADVHLLDGAGVPEATILPFIHDAAIDLAILGMTPRSGLMEAVLGHTAERVLPDAPCSLLVVRPAPPVS